MSQEKKEELKKVMINREMSKKFSITVSDYVHFKETTGGSDTDYMQHKSVKVPGNRWSEWKKVNGLVGVFKSKGRPPTKSKAVSMVDSLEEDIEKLIQENKTLKDKIAQRDKFYEDEKSAKKGNEAEQELKAALEALMGDPSQLLNLLVTRRIEEIERGGAND